MGSDPRFLITGAGGQLGRAFARLVPGAVALSHSDLDVCDAAAVKAAVARHRPEVILHAAAWTAVDAAESNPERAREVNAIAAGFVAAAASGALVVYPSTDYVFAGEGQIPLAEDAPTGPGSVYGATKLEGEGRVSSAGRHLIVRTSWVYGEGNNFVASILRAGSARSEVSVVADQHGLPTFASDLAAGILGLIAAGAEGTFHLAGGGPAATWADLAEEALAAAGFHARVRRVSTEEYDSGRQGPVARRPPFSVLDCTRAASCGVALRPWRQAVAEYVRARGAGG